MHRTHAVLLFVFSLLITGPAFAAPPGTTVYWISSNFCYRHCFSTASSCNNLCTADDCVVPPNQYHESASLTDLSGIVSGWTEVEGKIVDANELKAAAAVPYYIVKWISTPPYSGAPACSATSGNLSCRLTGEPWLQERRDPQIPNYAWTVQIAHRAYFGCYVGQYTTTTPCSVKLTGPGGTNGALADVEPGKVISGLAATVTCNNAPSDKVVKLTVAADANTGGHLNHGGTRPPGVVLPDSGNGVVPFSFTASPVSGDHTVTAECLDGTCGKDTGKVWVGIKDLVSMAPSIDYAFVGETGTHPANHYLIDTAIYRTTILAALYRLTLNRLFPGGDFRLHLNDASLERGGIFDIYDNWKRPHAEHCRGTVIDVRANDAPGAIPGGLRRYFERLARSVGADPLWEIPVDANGDDILELRHYHVRLMGSEGLQCAR